jgi:hypothetical protein
MGRNGGIVTMASMRDIIKKAADAKKAQDAEIAAKITNAAIDYEKEQERLRVLETQRKELEEAKEKTVS